MGANWFKTGQKAKDAALAESERQEKARASAREKMDKIWRFYLPKKASQFITFLDEPEYPDGSEFPFIFKEHQLHLNGHWRNWFTCLAVEDNDGNMSPCPLCESGDKPSVVSAYTIIDHSEWEKDGTKHKDEIKLFVCKMSVHEKIERQMAKRKTLRGMQFEVSRGGDNSPNTGDSFDFEGEVDLAKYDSPPIARYPEEFDAKPAEELRKILGQEVEANDKKVKW